MLGIVVNPTVEGKAAAKVSGGTYSAITRETTQHIAATLCQRSK